MAFLDESGIKLLANFIFTGIGAIIGFGSAVAVASRKERNDAALEFQGVFIKTLMDIDPHLRLQHGRRVDVFGIIERDFSSHVRAFLKFKQYIPYDKRSEFEKAWQEYGCYQADDGKFYPSICHYGPSSIFDDGEDKAEKAKRTINKLLSFAEINHKSPFEPDENR